MQLPYDIWKKIVSYISIEGTKRLYTVNSVLFNIAMDLRYQEAQLRTGDPSVCRVFCYPHLSCRPKTLHIDLGSIAKSLSLVKQEGDHTSTRRKIPFIAKFLTRNKSEQLGSVSEVVAAALNALPRLTAVTKLHITHDYIGKCHGDPLILQLLRNVWKILGDQLRSLQIQIVFENLELVLPTSLHLPYLEKLTVKAEGLCTTAAITCESVFPAIIQSHSSSLRDVSFTTENAAIDSRPICQSLKHLPCLQAVHLSFPFTPFIPRPFPAYRVLENCRHYLESLSLDFGIYTGNVPVRPLSIFDEDWCFVNLPRLRELKINPPTKTFNEKIIDYIHRFAPSLVSLCIESHIVLPYSGVQQLSCVFHNFLSLQNLSICIHWFTPRLLVLLARTLPHLQILNLQYTAVSYTEGKDLQLWQPEQSYLFYRTMQQYICTIFRKWQLVSLDYSCLSTPDVLRTPPIERALADNLPNVEWFCGVERLTYVRHASPVPLSPPPGRDYILGE